MLDKGKRKIYTEVSSKVLNNGGDEMPYDYSKLLGKIVEKVGTQCKFAELMGLSERTVSLKLNGKLGWKQAEMVKACQILGIPLTQLSIYFFELKVQRV